MKGKWDSRVYIDLFAGAGRARIKHSLKIVHTSASLAIAVRHPFDRYVLCEEDADNRDALRERISRHSLSSRVTVVPGDCNDSVEALLSAIPRASKSNRVLSFCLADPFRMRNLRFSTIEGLSSRFVDFLILIPSYMDAHRNLKSYVKPTSNVISDFTGDAEWRHEWQASIDRKKPQKFGMFVVDRLGLSMQRLKFLYGGLGDEEPVRTQGVLRYHLAFYSRNPVGMKFWQGARESARRQPAFL
jgi:three-Cys-motif partner protein